MYEVTKNANVKERLATLTFDDENLDIFLHTSVLDPFLSRSEALGVD